MAKLDAMNKDMFDEYVDGNGDGSATLDEIEMVSNNSESGPLIHGKFFQNGWTKILITFLGRLLHVPCNCSNDDQNDG